MPRAAAIGVWMESLPAAVEAESDEVLMRAVAEHRDRQAFACLAERHQRAAYNLARHLTPSSESAEDVLQDALLRAWASAEAFRHEGSVRGWLLRIVAREAFRANRKQRAERQRIERRQRQETPREEEPTTVNSEDTEQLSVLRALLGELPEEHRAMLALYFGAALSQEEIGKHFNLPQKTVSRRMQEILEALRGRLTQAGVAAAAPLLAADQLGTLLLNAENPPAGLLDRFATRLALAGASASVKVAAVKGSSAALWGWLATGAAVLAIGTGVAWKVRVSAQTPESQVTGAPAFAPEQSSEPAAPAAQAQFRWTFPGKLPSTFEPLTGGAFTFASMEGEQGLAMPLQEFSHFLIREKIPPEPLILSLRVRRRGNNPNQIGFRFSNGTTICSTRAILNEAKKYPPNEKQTYTFYYLDGFGIATSDGALYSACESKRLPGDDYIQFGGQNLLLFEFEVRAARRDEIPEEFRDPLVRFKDAQRTKWDERVPLREELK